MTQRDVVEQMADGMRLILAGVNSNMSLEDVLAVVDTAFLGLHSDHPAANEMFAAAMGAAVPHMTPSETKEAMAEVRKGQIEMLRVIEQKLRSKVP